MSKVFVIGFGVAVLIVGALVWGGFVWTKGNHLAPVGWISGIRVQKLADNETLMIIDFTVKNDSDVQMVAGVIDPWITTQEGKNIHGLLFAGADMEKTFSFHPALGPMLNPPLPKGGTIDGRRTVGLMAGVEFNVPVDEVESRKSVTMTIQDITGPVVEMTSK